ncbi:hypothetical protein [Dactylosporangium darangshiense]|uniref:hypothetical protein n=1 Tax=Dactylosporangium darangshiense TaxID=579108 RepID=UPI0036286662
MGVHQVEVLARCDRDHQLLAGVVARRGDHQVAADCAADLGELLAPGVYLCGEAVHVLRAGDEQAAAAQDLAGGVHRVLAVGPHRREEQRHSSAGGHQVGAAALAEREEAGARDRLELLEARELVVGLAPPAAAAHGLVDGQAGDPAGIE